MTALTTVCLVHVTVFVGRRNIAHAAETGRASRSIGGLMCRLTCERKCQNYVSRRHSVRGESEARNGRPRRTFRLMPTLQHFIRKRPGMNYVRQEGMTSMTCRLSN